RVGGAAYSAGWDVLVEPKEVVGVVTALEGLQPLVLRRSVSASDTVVTLVHQEVDIHAGVVRGERLPEPSDPLALLVETLTVVAGGDAVDVVGMTGGPPVERGVVVADVQDGPTQLKDRIRRAGRTDAQRMLDGNVNQFVGQLGHVAAAAVVPPAVRESGVKAR